MPASAALLEMCLLMALVSGARLDIKPSARALILNPWFVFTQAPFAGHRAKALIAKCRTESEGFNFRGVLGLIDLCESRLLAPQGPQSRGAPGARLPARATTASRRRPVAPAGARTRRRDRQLLKSCPRAPRGFPKSRRLTVCFLASNLEVRPTALGRQREFGAVGSSHWGGLDGADPAQTLAMSAVPRIPVVGAAAVGEAQ